MSYALVPYLIDLKKLTATAGSKDKRLIDAVVKRILRHLRNPQMETRNPCATLLRNSLWVTNWTRLMGTCTDSGSPVPLPRILDFPSIGYIPADRIKSTLKDMRQRFRDCSEADLGDLLQEFVTWLEEAKSQKATLIFFYC